VSANRSAVVVGSGGREHALARALAACGVDVVVSPGNPGMPATVGKGSIRTDSRGATELEAELYVIGPELPLVAGLADELRSMGRLVVGPGADGAMVEGSKAFMKELLDEAGVPTARHWTLHEASTAERVLSGLEPPYVIKTDGLAAGKGVLVTESLAEALADVADKLAGRSFGSAGETIVIEEGLRGPECSLIALCDGRRAVAFAPAQDFKRVGDGDAGPNTGGMGAYSPMPIVDDALVDELMAVAVSPTLDALRARGVDYRGLLYAGLMLTSSGPKVIEFNVRFGDPEAQVILPRAAGDLFELLRQAAAGELVDEPSFRPEAAVTVVLAARGYPASPETGAAISGLGPDGQLAEPIEGVTVFHAGTARPDPEGPFMVAGGRVLTVTGLGPSLAEARRRAYAGAEQISFDGVQRRSDIAATAAEQEAAE
jgi:phosphoribosylamine--glycine ligase